MRPRGVRGDVATRKHGNACGPGAAARGDGGIVVRRHEFHRGDAVHFPFGRGEGDAEALPVQAGLTALAGLLWVGGAFLR